VHHSPRRAPNGLVQILICLPSLWTMNRMLSTFFRTRSWTCPKHMACITGMSQSEVLVLLALSFCGWTEQEKYSVSGQFWGEYGCESTFKNLVWLEEHKHLSDSLTGFNFQVYLLTKNIENIPGFGWFCRFYIDRLFQGRKGHRLATVHNTLISGIQRYPA
jgi:hypothetical protein